MPRSDEIGLILVVFLLSLSSSGLCFQQNPCAIGQLRVSLYSTSLQESCGKLVIYDSIVGVPQNIAYPAAESDKKYVLITRLPTKSSFNDPKSTLLWLAESIKGTDLVNGDWILSEKYVERFAYHMWTPHESGSYRIQFFLFQQPKDHLEFVPGDRERFYLEHFATVNIMGVPVAGFEFVIETFHQW